MNIYVKYLSYVIRHKWFVFLESIKLGIPFLGLVHDWTKLLPSEFFPYANFFYGPEHKPRRDSTGYYKPVDTGDADMDFAWLLHQKRNKHHWQWWILPNDEDGVKVLNMPEKYRREMLADWRGAGKAQGTPDTLAWWMKNNEKMMLHEEVREWVEIMLGIKARNKYRVLE